MNYFKKSFTVGALPSEEYRNSWERIFARPTTGAGPPAVGTCGYCKIKEVKLHKMSRICAECAGISDTAKRCLFCIKPATSQDRCTEHQDVQLAPRSEQQRIR